MAGGFEYDVFISYARADDTDGWVTRIVDVIDEDLRQFSSDIRIFFDRSEIKTRQDWELRLLAGLRSARVLLICVSPNYLRSPYCRWEWDEFHQHAAQRAGADPVTGVFFVPVGSMNVDDDEPAARLWSDVSRLQLEDLAPWFGGGVEALQEQLVRDRVAALSSSVGDSVREARLAKAAPGNLVRYNPGFVGRTRELRALRDMLAGSGAIGVVASVHGLGGMGKTELAVTYAHSYAHAYQGGTWSVGAEHKTDLLDALSQLAFEPTLGMSVSDEDRRDPQRLGRLVLARLEELTGAARALDPDTASCLVLLDNASEASLLSASQIANLPSAAWLHILVTTRLGESDINVGGGRSQVGLVEIDRLSDDDAYELLRLHQPARDPEKRHKDFLDDEQRSAARELVDELGGYTLAVEQAAVYLGASTTRSPAQLLATLRDHGLVGLDRVAARELANKFRHKEKMVGAIVDATIATLPERAKRALAFASCMPPDLVVWEWLRELTEPSGDDPPAMDDPWADVDPSGVVPGQEDWRTVQRVLEGRNLITAGDQPGVGRIHRVIHRHVAEREVTASSDIAETFDAMLSIRAEMIAEEPRPQAMELALMADAVSHRLDGIAVPADHDRRLLGSAVWLCRPVIERLDVGTAHRLAGVVSQRLEDLTLRRDVSVEVDAGLRRLYSVSLDRVGYVARLRGDLVEAGRVFVRGLEIAEGLLALDPGRPEYLRDVSVSLERVGYVARLRGDLVEAGRVFVRGLEIREGLLASDPGRPEYLRDVSVSLNKVGDVAVLRGDLVEAGRVFVRGLEIRESLLASDPGRPEYLRDVAVSGHKLAILSEQVESLEAVTYWRIVDENLARMDEVGFLADSDRQFLDLAKSKLE